eukprot:scaffold107049_cov28-Tisochrysis_lutea.AAC.2
MTSQTKERLLGRNVHAPRGGAGVTEGLLLNATAGVLGSTYSLSFSGNDGLGVLREISSAEGLVVEVVRAASKIDEDDRHDSEDSTC